MSGSHLSKDFFDLVKAIGESKSKQEEDRIIMHEVGVLKRRMPEATVGRKKMKEFLVRMIYVEMLGHDASFGYIKAVELTASQNIAQKKTGYLTAALTLSPSHEFRFMLVNQMQRDLSSSNMLEAAAALTALCKLATPDMVPAVITDVVRLLKHDREIVRKKAVMVLHRMNQLDPDSVSHMGDHLRLMLCDKDPSVMGAALCLLHDLARVDSSSYKDLVPSFVSILKQITEHRLPRDFDYHRMPAPWIQMRLLRILAILGRADRTASEGMYEVLMDVMRRADTGINVGYAVVYECVRTVTTIYPNGPLLDAAAASISRFISAESHNLKYVGVTGLAAIVKDHPKYAQQHQMAVIDCLEDPDETLKRKTLDLLYTMTNPVNVEFITEKLLTFLEQGTDSFWRQDLVKRITQCAERFAPSNSWYVGVITRVFRLAGEMVKPDVAHNLMQLIAEGSGEDEEADVQLRRDAVDSYLELLETPAVPEQLMQVMAWVLGEYGSLASRRGGLRGVSEKLCGVASGLPFRDPHTSGFVITAMMKLSAQSGEVAPQVAHLLTLYSQSKESDLQQRCLEFMQLAREGPATMAAVLPVDASCEDVQADENLSHLDGIVSKALASGAVKYSPPANAEDDSDKEEHAAATKASGSSFNLTPYARPGQPSAAATPAVSQAPLPPPQASGGGAGTPLSTADVFASGPRLRPVAKVWGRPKPHEQQKQEQPQQSQQPTTAAGTKLPGGNVSITGSEHPENASDVADPVGWRSVSSSGRGSWGASASEGHRASMEEDPVKAAQRAEKEKMAAMLFGGMTTPGGSDNTRTAPRSTPSQANRSHPVQDRVTPLDKVETNIASATQSAKAATHPSESAVVKAEPIDLLDFMSMETSPTKEGEQSTNGVMNLTGADKASVSSASTGAEAIATASKVDQFGLDLLGSSEKPSTSNGETPNSVSQSAASPALLGDLLSGGKVNDGNGGDRVDGHSAGTTRGARGDILAEAMNGLKPLDSSPSESATSRSPGSHAGVVSDLDLSSLMLGGGDTPNTAEGSRLTSSRFAYGGKVVAPLMITTGEFGQRWMTYGGERRAAGIALKSEGNTPQAVASRLKEALGVHTVEIIAHTSEGICAGELTGGNSACLVHCKVWPSRSTADITVRAADPGLADAAVAFARRVLLA